MRPTRADRRRPDSPESHDGDPPLDLRRVVIDNVGPQVDCGALPAKATVGLGVEVSADLVLDGHDLVMGMVRHGPAGPGGPHPPVGSADMVDIAMGLDRWGAWVVPTGEGAWWFEIAAMPDDYGSWGRDLLRRHVAGQNLEVELEVGALMADARRGAVTRPEQDALALAALAAQLRDRDLPVEARVTAASAPAAVGLMRRTASWHLATVAGPFPLFVDRLLGGFSAWYEMFPRSEGAEPPHRSGTFATAAARLPAIAAMGFDIVYLPPVHPIGHTHRKGRNNTLVAEPGDPGSPWAIGDESGGHDAVHPDLGTVADFEAFVGAAHRVGLEVALDLAVQCSPDHPWVREHPQWFRHRPDGSIRYAENPPKRYQDIVPVDFETPDRAALERELLGVVLLWMSRGVRVFRVDNPHTKPLTMWHRLIEEVHRRDPGVVFLAEAFTRPRVMERLAKNGFTQSYTYFTWRTGRAELESYLEELSRPGMTDFFRPCFWPNTPDILHQSLQRGGPPAFRLRAVLAAMTAPSWGVYSGYELFENMAVREGSEEYLDSEKYQYRPRDWERADSLAPLLTRLNEIRRRHAAAIAQMRTLRVHRVEGDDLIAVSRTDHAGTDRLLVVANLDVHSAREGVVALDTRALGIPDGAAVEAHDELTDTTYVWSGARNYVRLDPALQPAHVLHLRLR